jgi:hypothetical protein
MVVVCGVAGEEITIHGGRVMHMGLVQLDKQILVYTFHPKPLSTHQTGFDSFRCWLEKDIDIVWIEGVFTSLI